MMDADLRKVRLNLWLNDCLTYETVKSPLIVGDERISGSRSPYYKVIKPTRDCFDGESKNLNSLGQKSEGTTEEGFEIFSISSIASEELNNLRQIRLKMWLDEDLEGLKIFRQKLLRSHQGEPSNNRHFLNLGLEDCNKRADDGSSVPKMKTSKSAHKPLKPMPPIPSDQELQCQFLDRQPHQELENPVVDDDKNSVSENFHEYNIEKHQEVQDATEICSAPEFPPTTCALNIEEENAADEDKSFMLFEKKSGKKKVDLQSKVQIPTSMEVYETLPIRDTTMKESVNTLVVKGVRERDVNVQEGSTRYPLVLLLKVRDQGLILNCVEDRSYEGPRQQIGNKYFQSIASLQVDKEVFVKIPQHDLCWWNSVINIPFQCVHLKCVESERGQEVQGVEQDLNMGSLKMGNFSRNQLSSKVTNTAKSKDCYIKTGEFVSLESLMIEIFRLAFEFGQRTTSKSSEIEFSLKQKLSSYRFNRAMEKKMSREENEVSENEILRILDTRICDHFAEVSNEEWFMALMLPDMCFPRFGLVSFIQGASFFTGSLYKGLEGLLATSTTVSTEGKYLELASHDIFSKIVKLDALTPIATEMIFGGFEDNEHKSEPNIPTLESVGMTEMRIGIAIGKGLTIDDREYKSRVELGSSDNVSKMVIEGFAADLRIVETGDIFLGLYNGENYELLQRSWDPGGVVLNGILKYSAIDKRRLF